MICHRISSQNLRDFKLNRVFQFQSFHPSATVGGWQKSVWDPIRSSATQTGLDNISQKRKNYKFASLQVRQGYLVFGSDIGFDQHKLTFGRKIASTARSYRREIFT